MTWGCSDTVKNRCTPSSDIIMHMYFELVSIYNSFLPQKLPQHRTVLKNGNPKLGVMRHTNNPALGRLKQEYCWEFEENMGSIMKP